MDSNEKKKKMEASEFDKFQTNRFRVVRCIRNFLKVVLSFFAELKKSEWEHINNLPNPGSDDKLVCSHLKLLVKSLCQIHALHGYPSDSGTYVRAT